MAEALAELSGESSNAQKGRYLTFLLEKEVFGIEIKYVTEIVKIQNINLLPDAPDYIKGVINLRGNIIPVIDMRLRLNKEAHSYTDRTSIIVIDMEDTPVGLIVDRVVEVATINDDDISAPPGNNTGYQSRYIKGIGKSGDTIRLLLDCERLFVTEETENS